MAEFSYSKGFLVYDDLAWDCNEFLHGSEQVNHCAIGYWHAGLADEMIFAAFATDADACFVLLKSAGVVVNSDVGFVPVAGGIARITSAGEYFFMTDKATKTLLASIAMTDLIGGDVSGSIIIEYTSPDGTIQDLKGDLIGTDRIVYYCEALTAGGHRLSIFNVDGPTTYTTDFGSADDTGGFLAGRYDGTLYWAFGGKVHVKYHPELIAANDWIFDCTYGAMLDDFAGATIDDLKWDDEVLTGTMASCFSQLNNLLFSTNSTAGNAQASLFHLSRCVGDFSRKIKLTVSTWPALTPGLNCWAGIAFQSSDGLTTYVICRGYRASDSKYFTNMLVYSGGILVDNWEALSLTDTINPIYLTIGRRANATGKLIAGGYSPDDSSWTIHTFVDTAGDDLALNCGIAVFCNSGGAFAGTIGNFTFYTNDSEILDNVTDADITAAALSPKFVMGSRRIALGFTDEFQVIRTNETDEGGASEAAADVDANFTAASGVFDSTVISALAVSDDGESAFIGGELGVDQVDIDTHNAPVGLRHYDDEYDHAQPLTWIDVTCLDFDDDGFIYGTNVSTGGAASGDPVDPYSPGGGYLGSGGGGWVMPDFTAPVGSDAWARARNTDEAASGANSPDPLPADYLHAHIERRIASGPWYRLKTTGWTLYAGAWVHSTDVAYEYDATLGDIGTIAQDEDLANGRYEYRWVYHDEAGNQDEATAYSEYPSGASVYIGIPRITALTINAGVSPTTVLGVTLAISAHSGTTSGSIANDVYEVKFHNDGESAADSPWQRYVVGQSYPHLLRDEAGLRTVYAYVRHQTGTESSPTPASIVYAPVPVATSPAASFERAMICYGNAGDTNFTSDGAESISTTSEETGFDVENVQQNDVQACWKSDGLGDATGGPVTFVYTAIVTFDLGAYKTIELAAILGHNFNDMYELSGASAQGAYLEYWSGVSWASMVNLMQQRNYDYILYRPKINAKLWRIRMTLTRSALLALPVGTAWTIGRIILNEQALCFQPSSNFARDFQVEWVDSSDVTLTQGQARRTVENSTYRVGTYPFSDLSLTDHMTFLDIWKRQGSRRPVLIIQDPHRVSPATGYHATAIYGYLTDKFPIKFTVNDYGSLTIEVEEAAG